MSVICEGRCQTVGGEILKMPQRKSVRGVFEGYLLDAYASTLGG